MKKLLVPRGYLSPTQVDMWMNSRERYIENYIYGNEDKISNPFMEFGDRFAKALETGDAQGDPTLELAIVLLPRYELREHTLREPLDTSHGKVDLLGKMDTFDPVRLRIRDDKTGKVPWTQTRANKHLQLRHYAALVWMKYKKLPSEMWINWAETEEAASGAIRLTGRVESFRVDVSLVEVLRYLTMTSTVAQEIDQEYRKYLKTLT